MTFEDEKELELLIVKAFEETQTNPIDGSSCFDSLTRQVSVKGYGIIDIFGTNVYYEEGMANIDICVHELKNNKITCADVGQIAKYFIGVKRYLKNHLGVNVDHEGHGYKNNTNFRLCGYLVGPKYDNGDVCFLVDSIPWLECYHFSINFDGVRFDESSGWHTKDEPSDYYTLGGFDIIKEIVECKKNAANEEQQAENN